MKRFDYEKLRATRIERKQTLDVVSESTGLTKSALSQIEGGGSNPRLDTISKLTAHFAVPFDFFLTDDATTVAPENAA